MAKEHLDQEVRRHGRARHVMSALVLEPDWIVPIETPATRRGYLVVDSGKILFVGSSLPEKYNSLASIRLNRCALLPGLINSHCHLEFSDLESPIPAGDSFVDWLQRVMTRRRQDAQRSPEEVLAARANAVQLGFRESWQSGVRWIVDNVTAPWDREWIQQAAQECRNQLQRHVRDAFVPDSLLRIQPCFELLDVNPDRAQQTSAFALEQLNAPKSALLAPGGLAPHAPYTASLEVTRTASDWSRRHRGLVSMHLAESLQELEWLQSRSGALGDWIGPHLGPQHRSHIGTVSQHLLTLSDAWRGLVVHGNYLSDQEVQFLIDHRDRMAVVYCPRTHAFFGHENHPAPRMSEARVQVFLGTDSRASNPNLSVWEEVQFLCRQDKTWGRAQAASMVSCNPATFFESVEGIGTLRAGSRSQLTAFNIDPQEPEPQVPCHTEDALWEYLIAHGRPFPLEMHPAFADVV